MCLFLYLLATASCHSLMGTQHMRGVFGKGPSGPSAVHSNSMYPGPTDTEVEAFVAPNVHGRAYACPLVVTTCEYPKVGRWLPYYTVRTTYGYCTLTH